MSRTTICQKLLYVADNWSQRIIFFRGIFKKSNQPMKMQSPPANAMAFSRSPNFKKRPWERGCYHAYRLTKVFRCACTGIKVKQFVRLLSLYTLCIAYVNAIYCLPKDQQAFSLNNFPYVSFFIFYIFNFY